MAARKANVRFQKFFSPAFVYIHRAKYNFSRDMFCLPHFWAKIHSVFETSIASPMASVASINNNLVESGFINLQHYSSPYICLFFHPVFLCAFILHNLPKCFINQNNPRSIISALLLLECLWDGGLQNEYLKHFQSVTLKYLSHCYNQIS